MHSDSGERRLLLAVLEDAIRQRKARNEPFAFESICDALEIDAGYLRRRLLQGGFAAPVRRRTARRPVISRSRPCSRSH
jgi:hypothetical protein